MRRVTEEEWHHAEVPGTVYTDLLRNGEIQDPFWKDNEDAACALMNEDYEYECRFAPEGKLLSNRKKILRFEGLDTLAAVYLNGSLLGETCNMHRTWEYEITDLLREKENILRVVFYSPLKFIAQAYRKYGNIGNEDTYEGFMHLRKAHYMFGWDWGAHLPDAGIFRKVYILGIQEGKIDGVYIRQKHEEGKVTLYFEAEASQGEISGRRWTAAVSSPQGERYSTELGNDGRGELIIENPRLWWPNGLGEQPLYEAEVVLESGGEICDVWKKKIGLRTMTVRREKDQWGESFAHEVNGVCFFAMGADYIPEDHLLGRRSKERTRKLLEDCR